MRRLDNIDLRLLRVFATLVEAGGFADAQIALNLSQPDAQHPSRRPRAKARRGALRARAPRLSPDAVRRSNATRRPAALCRHPCVPGAGWPAQRPTRRPVADRHRRRRRDEPRARASARHRPVHGECGKRLHRPRAWHPHDLEQAIADGRRDVVIGPFSQKAPGVTYVALLPGAARPLLRQRPSALRGDERCRSTRRPSRSLCSRSEAIGTSTTSTGSTIRAPRLTSSTWRRRRC